jgi:hypothetical protein
LFLHHGSDPRKLHHCKILIITPLDEGALHKVLISHVVTRRQSNQIGEEIHDVMLTRSLVHVNARLHTLYPQNNLLDLID